MNSTDDLIEKIRKNDSIFVKHINTMLKASKKSTKLLIAENQVGIYKLLYHPASNLQSTLRNLELATDVYLCENVENDQSMLDDLLKLGARVILIPKESTEHYTMIHTPNLFLQCGTPRMIWMETYHKSGSMYARDVIFTKSAYQSVCESIRENFSKLEDVSKEIKKVA